MQTKSRSHCSHSL